MSHKQSGTLFLTTAILLATSSAAEPHKATLCIAPVPEIADSRSAPGLNCKSADLSFKIDSTSIKAWPINESIRIEDLDADMKHRVVVFCGGKPQQSFSFRFADYKSSKLCLFISDLYKTAQLWEDKQSPWCKCK